MTERRWTSLSSVPPRIARLAVPCAAFLLLLLPPLPLHSVDTPLRVGWPRVGFERKILNRQVTGASDTDIFVRASIENVPGGSAHKARIHVAVRDSSTRDIVHSLSSAVFSVRRGNSFVEATLRLDASAVPLAPGAYTAQAIVIAGPGSTPTEGFRKILSILSETQGKPPFALQATKEQGLLVLGPEPEKIATYEAEIATGRPELIYRGLSHLVTHFRSRRQHGSAEAKVNAVINHPAFDFDPALAGLKRIFRTWIADDRFHAGDVAGAVSLLDQEIAAAPTDSMFLGEPFNARALTQLARIKRAGGDLAGAIATYDALIASPEVGGTGSAIDARKERGEMYLEVGNLTAARDDFEFLAGSDEDCQEEEPLAPCPDPASAKQARRWLRYLDSDRAWIRSTPGAVFDALRTALAQRNLALLDAIAGRVDFKFGPVGAEWERLPWETVRPFVARVFDEAISLQLRTPTTLSDGRGYAVVRDIGRIAGLPTDLVFLVDKTPFGWQFSGLGGVYRLLTADTGAPPSPQPPLPPPPGAPVIPADQSELVSLKAPWLAGESMQAGGLSYDIDWTLFIGDPPTVLLELLFNTLVRFDRCGPTVPGFYYNIQGHTGLNAFSIDFMDGYGPVGCVDIPLVGEKCLPDPAGPALLLDELARSLSDVAYEWADEPHGVNFLAPAYGDPVPAAAAGVVVRKQFGYVDGSSGEENRVDMAVWPGAYPLSAREFLAGGRYALTCPGVQDPFSCALKTTGAPYWIEYLHLRQSDPFPMGGSYPASSLGLWVDQGDLVGEMDDTGTSFTSHLHWTLLARPTIDDDAGTWSLWQPVRPTLEEHFMSDEDNGRCIRSSNEHSLPDIDGDGIPNRDDNCLLVSNPDQADGDNDFIGDACGTDLDNDGVPNAEDSCPDHPGTTVRVCEGSDCHLEQYDFDGDGLGDPCDPDRDDDGFTNDPTVCTNSPAQCDRCRNFPDQCNCDGGGAYPQECVEQYGACSGSPTNVDTTPDGCDFDDDGDGWRDAGEYHESCGSLADVFPRDYTRAGDHDGDGVDTLVDNCPCAADVTDCFDQGVLDPDYTDLVNLGTPPNI